LDCEDRIASKRLSERETRIAIGEDIPAAIALDPKKLTGGRVAVKSF
jgi:hypothetical protein